MIHRLAVNPKYQGLGLGKVLMAFAEEKAVETGLACIRSDTCCVNGRMSSLFHRSGYKQAGIINFPSCRHDFHCYEKEVRSRVI